jgi:broad specificity phosphatase PhoE
MERDDTRIFLIRHGETEYNRLGVFRGRLEMDLNDRGRKQAREIGLALRGEGLCRLYVSPLGRAVETARIIAESLEVDYVIDQAFNNIELGEWQGVAKEKIQHDYPQMWAAWTSEPENLVIPGGETVRDVQQRAFAGLLRLAKVKSPPFGIVTHRSVIKSLAAAMLSVPQPYFWKFYIDNAAYSIFEFGSLGFALTAWNINSHLSDKVTEVF